MLYRFYEDSIVLLSTLAQIKLILTIVLMSAISYKFVLKKKKTLALNGPPPQVDGGIGPLGLVGLWAGYRVSKK
jgi:hypothetical protein